MQIECWWSRIMAFLYVFLQSTGKIFNFFKIWGTVFPHFGYSFALWRRVVFTIWTVSPSSMSRERQRCHLYFGDNRLLLATTKLTLDYLGFSAETVADVLFNDGNWYQLCSSFHHSNLLATETRYRFHFSSFDQSAFNTNILVHVGEFIPNSRGGISFVTSKTRCSSTVGKGKGSQYGNHIGRSLAGASLMTMARQSETFRIHFRSFFTISGWRSYTGSWFWNCVRLRNQVRTRWANLFWERIYKWIIQVWSIQCMPTQKRSNAVTLQSRMQTRWCLSMKIQRFTLVIVNDQGPVQTGSDKFKPDFESVWTKDRALNRATLKKSRRLRRGLTLTEHINQRLRQNQRSAKQRNEFLPTGSFLNISLLGTSSFLDLIGWFFENICKRWKTS